MSGANVGVHFCELHMKTITLVVSLSAVLATPIFGQAPADVPPEKAAVVANDRAFEAAYAKGDPKALADFFTEKAEYTTEDGQVFQGRAAIEDALRAGLII